MRECECDGCQFPLGWLGEVYSEKKHTSKTNMNSTEQEKNLPSQEVRILQGSADVPGIVPARSLSSSDKGLSQVLAAGICEEWDTADDNEESVKSVGRTKLSRPSSQLSIHSVCSTGNARSASMDFEEERENRKRSRKYMQQESSEGEEEENKIPISQRAKKGKQKIRSSEEEEGKSEGTQKKSEQCAKQIIVVSDQDNADCPAVPSSTERGKGDEDGRGKEEEVISRNPDGSTTVRRQGKIIILKKRGRKKKIRRQALGVEELGIHELEDSDDSESYGVLSAPEMGATAMEYLEDIEKIRIKCGNIKGDLSGIIKRRISKSKEIIKGLVKTIEKEGNRQEGGEDVSFLKMRNKELKARLKEKERDNYNREKEIEQLHKVIKELREELNVLKVKVTNIEKKEEESPKRKKASIASIGSRSLMYRRDRTISASMNERETSAADDSDATVLMEEYLPVRGSGPGPGPGPGPYPSLARNDVPGPSGSDYGQTSNLKKKKKEELMESKYIREKIRKDGTLGNIEGRKGIGNAGNESSQVSLPQRQPRVSKPNIRVVENVVVQPTEETRRLVEERRRLIEKNKEIIERKEQAAVEKTVKSGKEEVITVEWSEQKSRKERRKEKKKIAEENQRKATQAGKNKVKRKPPRSSAVTVRVNEDFTYAEVLKIARNQISLEGLGIEKTKLRKTATGNMLIEIPGNDKKEEADRLANEMRRVLEGKATIARPCIKGEVRMFGLDDSITREEVREVIAKLGKCKDEDIRVGEIKTMRSGLGMVWVQCPLVSAVSLSNLEKVKIGWSVVRIELLKAREIQCYRCWQFGHLKLKCTASIDRTKLCYKCGLEGHRVRDCPNEAQCIVCRDLKKVSNHRIGSAACIANRKVDRADKSSIETKKVDSQLKPKGKVIVIEDDTRRMEVVENNNNDD